MAFMSAEDECGEAEMILFPKLYSEIGNKISENKVYVFVGNPELKEVYGNESEDSVTILLKSVLTPEEALASLAENRKSNADEKAQSLYIKVTDANSHRLDDAIALAARVAGNSRILVYFEKEKRLCAAKGQSTLINERLLRQLREIMGEENIAVK
jgi:DNA polymerase III alpha subunit